ncbi:pyridoxal 5'-phosphate synthase-like subunit PDX1.2 [Tanacetum coccineum]
MVNPVSNTQDTTSNNNTINDPLHLASSDNPGMVLTNTPFNGGNFLGWSRNVKMALGAKLKLRFIDGSCHKPAITDENVQRWVRCDYMVTYWILNSMVTELSEAFLYAQSAYELWKEIAERYGQSNGPLIYQLESELSKITQGNLSIAAFFNKLKRCWDELQNLNGLPVCNCGKMQECTCGVLDKVLERDSHLKLIKFLMKLSDEYESVRSQILAMDPLPNVNKAYYIVQQINKQKQVTSHTFDPYAFFANTNNTRHNNNTIREGKKAKKSARIAAHVSSGFEDTVHRETPFDLGAENEIGMGQNGNVDQRLVAAVFSFALFCHPQMNIRLDWVTDTGASDHMTPHFSLFISIRYLSDPIMVHLPDGRSLKVTIVGEVALTPSLILSDVFYIPETLPLKKLWQLSHKLSSPFTVLNKAAYSNVVNTESNLDIQLFHDRLGHTFVSKLVHIPEYDKTRATWTYLIHSKDQIPTLLITFLVYIDNHFKAKPKFIRTDNGTEVINKSCAALFKTKGILH